MTCYCYILECADGTFYTGWTADPKRRLSQHNKGTASRYTRSRLPVKLVYLEPQPNRRAAMKRERAIKKMGRERKRKLVDGEKVNTYTGRQESSPQDRKALGAWILETCLPVYVSTCVPLLNP